MADAITGAAIIAKDGFGTQYIEAEWYEVTLLSTAVDDMNIGTRLFDEGGFATQYFSELWSSAATALNRDELNNGVIIVDANGYADPSFIASWENLIS